MLKSQASMTIKGVQKRRDIGGVMRRVRDMHTHRCAPKDAMPSHSKRLWTLSDQFSIASVASSFDNFVEELEGPSGRGLNERMGICTLKDSFCVGWTRVFCGP